MAKPFPGIPAGRVQVTPVPNMIFSELLPALDDLAEAQITLHIYYLLSQKKGSPRYVTLEELRADSALQRALSFREDDLQRGLGKAEARGTLLHLVAHEEDWYFFNTSESRRAVEKLEQGNGQELSSVRRPVSPAVPAPNIFKLYEQNIGMLSPLIAEELKEAEEIYPAHVIEDAFRIAAENNVRKWSYVRTILLDWAREGKYEKTGRDSKKRRQPLIRGKLANRAKSRE